MRPFNNYQLYLITKLKHYKKNSNIIININEAF